MNKCDILNKSYCIVIAYYVFYFYCTVKVLDSESA